MSEQENKGILMEEAEYIEYLEQQKKRNAEAMKEPVAQISMYQMNKDLVKNLKKMSNMDINKALEKVEEWFEDQTDLHYALLNHEQHYFTIFERDFNKQYSVKSFINNNI